MTVDEKYTSLVRTHFVETDDFLIFHFTLIIGNLPTSADPVTFTNEQSNDLLRILRADSRYRIKILKITGFASIAGSSEFNLELSKKRANEFYDEIVRLKQVNSLDNLFLNPKEQVVSAFGELELPSDDPNSAVARKVEIRFSQKYTIPKPAGGTEPRSTQWKLDLGPEITPGGFLLPFTTFSSGTLTLMADGVNYTDADIDRNCQATIHSVGVGLGADKLLKKFKFFQALDKKIKSVGEWWDEGLSSAFNTATGSAKSILIKNKIKEILLELRDKTGDTGFSVDIPDTIPDPVFFTEQPYTLNELQTFDLMGLDGSLAVPLAGVKVSVSVYMVMVSPIALFVNSGFSFEPGLSTDFLSIDFKKIRINT